MLKGSIQVGTTWIIYEQDRCKGLSVDSARISFGNLKERRLI